LGGLKKATDPRRAMKSAVKKLKKQKAARLAQGIQEPGSPAPFDAEALLLQGRHIETLLECIEMFRAAISQERKTSRHLAAAVLRRLYVPDVPPSHPSYLALRRFHLYSQNEEDGIVLAIVQAIGMDTGRCVEICAGDNGGNAAFLIREMGWAGLLVDGNPDKVAACAAEFEETDAVVAQAWVTAENVNELMHGHGFDDCDYLGIDVDGNDYWIWKAVVARPRLVVVEYNSTLGSEAAVTIPYDPTFDRHRNKERNLPREYFGASLAALTALGRTKGYRLVGVEPRGVNAFFVRNDSAPSLPERSVADVFQRKRKGDVRLDAIEGDVRAYFAERGHALEDVG
jgi:hypothetical protein